MRRTLAHMALRTTEQTPLHILALSGSLRDASSNTVLLRAAARLAPEAVTVTIENGLSGLPYFNPDLDGEHAPVPVQEFRACLRQADGVLICSPEYAHGVPGALKNALDWIVSSGELVHKPVVLINASFASTHAQASLMETLTVMMAQVDAVRVPLPTNKIDEAAILAHAEMSQALRDVMTHLASLARRQNAKAG